MKLHAKKVGWLLPLLLSACMHRADLSQVQPLAPPLEDAPQPKPDSATANLPPPVIFAPKPTPPPQVDVQPQKPRQTVKHKKSSKPTTPVATPGAGQAVTQEASVDSNPAEVSAIGNLSTGEAPDLKKDAADAIEDVEKGLNLITRKLNDQDVKTSAQIKEYLKQARTALNSGDVVGAKTLATKAKVLLGELSE
jgi:outer membrane biosynthesis protein TonB